MECRAKDRVRKREFIKDSAKRRHILLSRKKSTVVRGNTPFCLALVHSPAKERDFFPKRRGLVEACFGALQFQKFACLLLQRAAAIKPVVFVREQVFIFGVGDEQ